MSVLSQSMLNKFNSIVSDVNLANTAAHIKHKPAADN